MKPMNADPTIHHLRVLLLYQPFCLFFDIPSTPARQLTDSFLQLHEHCLIHLGK